MTPQFLVVDQNQSVNPWDHVNVCAKFVPPAAATVGTYTKTCAQNTLWKHFLKNFLIRSGL